MILKKIFITKLYNMTSKNNDDINNIIDKIHYEYGSIIMKMLKKEFDFDYDLLSSFGNSWSSEDNFSKIFPLIKEILESNNKKDASNFIPGHGGFLDRVDGLIWIFIFGHFLI